MKPDNTSQHLQSQFFFGETDHLPVDLSLTSHQSRLVFVCILQMIFGDVFFSARVFSWWARMFLWLTIMYESRGVTGCLGEVVFQLFYQGSLKGKASFLITWLWVCRLARPSASLKQRVKLVILSARCSLPSTSSSRSYTRVSCGVWAPELGFSSLLLIPSVTEEEGEIGNVVMPASSIWFLSLLSS